MCMIRGEWIVVIKFDHILLFFLDPDFRFILVSIHEVYVHESERTTQSRLDKRPQLPFEPRTFSFIGNRDKGSHFYIGPVHHTF